MVTLRWYQQEAVDQAINAINNKQSGGIELPTGSGKSVVIAAITAYAASLSMRTLVLTHTKELVKQDASAISRFGVRGIGILSAGLKSFSLRSPVTVGSVQTTASRINSLPQQDLIIIDEAHRVEDSSSSQYGKILDASPNAIVISMTATPWRLKEGHIYDGSSRLGIPIYSAITTQSIQRMVSDGHLCPLVSISPSTQIDTSGIRTTAGDFNSHDSSERLSLVLQQCCSHMVSASANRSRGIIYVPTVESASAVVNTLSDLGQSAKAITGDTPPAERDSSLSKHKAGKFRWLVNVAVLTTGYDDPELDVIAIMRPTKSPSLHVQILGRGLRVHPSKSNTLVLDYAGNISRLGPIDDPVVRLKGQRGSAGIAPVKHCISTSCECVMHTSATVCPSCGEIQPPPDKSKRITVSASTDVAMTAAIQSLPRPFYMAINREGASIVQDSSGRQYLACKVGQLSIILTDARCRAMRVPFHTDPTVMLRSLPEHDMYLPCIIDHSSGKPKYTIAKNLSLGEIYATAINPATSHFVRDGVLTSVPHITPQLARQLSIPVAELRVRISSAISLIKRGLKGKATTDSYDAWHTSLINRVNTKNT